MASGFAEVHFKGTRKDYFTYTDLELSSGQHVVVQADRGEDVGEVTACLLYTSDAADDAMNV